MRYNLSMPGPRPGLKKTRFFAVLKYKIDPLTELKNKGFTTYKIRRDGLFGGADVQKMLNGEPLGINGLSRLCELLHRQPGEILEWIPDGSPAAEE